MKNMKHILASLLLSAGSLCMLADDCQINVAVAPIVDGDNVPQAVSDRMESQLRNMMSRAGVTGSTYESQFFIAGKFDNAFFDRIGERYVLNTEVTLYIGDADNQKIFASKTFPVKGWGNSEERAYIKAMGDISGSNREMINWVRDAKDKIVDYYNKNYNTYLSKARTAMNSRNYDEALYWATSVPECCVGYQQACDLALEIYRKNTDYESSNMLAMARAAWAANPNQDGAAEAMSYIAMIDPASSSYSAGQSLASEIKKTVRSDYEFETQEKYRDAVALEKKRIDAARAIGVAWGQNQPKTINRYHFISRY